MNTTTKRRSVWVYVNTTTEDILPRSMWIPPQKTICLGLCEYHHQKTIGLGLYEYQYGRQSVWVYVNTTTDDNLSRSMWIPPQQAVCSSRALKPFVIDSGRLKTALRYPPILWYFRGKKLRLVYRFWESLNIFSTIKFSFRPLFLFATSPAINIVFCSTSILYWNFSVLNIQI